MCGFSNVCVCVCVCVGFVMCGCVYVCGFCNMCLCVCVVFEYLGVCMFGFCIVCVYVWVFNM